MRMFFSPRSVCLAAALGALTAAPAASDGKPQGAPFRTVFPLSGMGPEWALPEYDHSMGRFITAWRGDMAKLDDAGLVFTLAASDPAHRVSRERMREDDGSLKAAGMTSKPFIGAQLQRNKWYGYGRYEIVLRPSDVPGTATSFYLYSGNGSHEEIELVFPGRKPGMARVDLVRDGQAMARDPDVDLTFEAGPDERLFVIEWSPESVVWFAGDAEVLRVDDPDRIPRPPAKIHLELWAAGKKQADGFGLAAPETEAEALLQCASFRAPGAETPQCSELVSPL